MCELLSSPFGLRKSTSKLHKVIRQATLRKRMITVVEIHILSNTYFKYIFKIFLKSIFRMLLLFFIFLNLNFS